MKSEKIRYAAFWGKTELSGRVLFSVFLHFIASSIARSHPSASFFPSSCPLWSYIFLRLFLLPLLPSPSLAIIIYHLKQGLQQSVVSVPVRLVAVEAIRVVAVDTVLGASVLVDQVQSLVQRLRGEPCCGRREAPARLLLPPGGCRLGLLQGRGLPVEGRLKEAQ